MGMAATLLNDAEPFWLLAEGPIWNHVKIGQSVSEKEDV